MTETTFFAAFIALFGVIAAYLVVLERRANRIEAALQANRGPDAPTTAKKARGDDEP